MSFSRQEKTITTGRVNQKTRTRLSLIEAAQTLMREGKAPSMQEVAERALISLATAYRYFTSVEALCGEAAVTAAFPLDPTLAAIDAAGDDLLKRVEACVRAVNFQFIDDQRMARRAARSGIDNWFAQQELPDAERAPVRLGQRNSFITKILEPWKQALAKKDYQRLANTLTLVFGTEQMIAFTDVARLDASDAKKASLDAARWLTLGAMHELGLADAHPKKPKRVP